MLTETQLQTLATAIRASIDPVVVAALEIRDDVSLTAWCDAESTQSAWSASVTGSALFELTDVTKFDSLTAGKRDAWRLMLTYAPVDFSRQKNRKAVQDVWGNTDSVAVLNGVTRKATNAEHALGGVDATTNTVTAWKLNYSGSVSLTEVSTALNRY